MIPKITHGQLLKFDNLCKSMHQYSFMRVSKPRRAIQLQQARTLLTSNPKITYVEMAKKIGLSRNTIPKLLQEIKLENDTVIRERWKMLINDITFRAGNHVALLEKMTAQLESSGRVKDCISLVKTDWTITKDLLRLHLDYMGVLPGPKSLVQVNIQK